jgi:DNA polymerase III delta prime subunit
MASVAAQRIMTFDKKHHVHPFFRKPDNQTPQTVAAESSRDDPPPVAQDASGVEEKGTGKRKKASKRNSNGTKANGSKQPSLLAFVGLDTATIPPETTESATANNEHANPEEGSENTLEEDPNYERRKRRKTVSPDPAEEGFFAIVEKNSADHVEHVDQEFESLLWHQQLLAEASKDEQGSAAAQEAETADNDTANITSNKMTATFIPPTSSQEPEVTWNTTSDPPVPSSADADILGTADAMLEQKAEQAVPGGEESQADLALDSYRDGEGSKATPQTPAPLANSRPVRMIKLKGGKLASPPKPKSKPEPEQVEGKKKTRRKGKHGKQLIVTINYGKSDEGNAVGEKINRILCGDERFEPKLTDAIPQSKMSTPKKTAAKISLVKPSGPPKPTHPFFSGKPLPKPAQEPLSIAKDVAEDNVKMASPRKSSATTPGKIRAQAQAHRASLSFPAFGLTSGAPFQLRPKKASSTREAPWPWEGIVHARGPIDEVPVIHSDLAELGLQEGHLKRKQVTVVVRESEDIVQQCSRGLKSDDVRSSLRVPERVVTTGVQMQKIISAELHARFKLSNDADSESDDAVVVRRQQLQHAPHPALSTMYASIETTLTPFDRYECETQAWTQKYAPKCAVEVLQSGKEALILRDWLKNSTISAVEKGSNRSTTGSHITSTKSKAKPEKKKKRKRPEDLDDFLVSSEDESAEAAELEELEDDANASSRDPQKRSLVRRGGMGVRGAIKSCNAVLISGPHGCGKTAAVYAVAKELGFEVFELNSGSRRSGKDVLEKVGDMTENHLVQQVSKALSEKTDAKDEKPINIDIVKDDTPDIKQESMTSFFKPAAQKKKTGAKISSVHVPTPAPVKEKEANTQQPRQEQKQSLILLEEVDVLFDEDKQFWLTVLALAAHSKRPIVMTCANENLVPLDSLALHAILRFAAPPADLAIDYLLLTAALEGHLLERSAVKSLYKSNGNDLRASIMSLDFWCQIGVGDNAGGFNWMIDRYPPGIDVDEHGSTLRVASKHTYTIGMGIVSQDLLKDSSRDGFDKAESLLVMGWYDWQLLSENILPQTKIVHDEMSHNFTNPSSESNLLSLQDFEFLADCASAADMYCGFGMREAIKVCSRSLLILTLRMLIVYSNRWTHHRRISPTKHAQTTSLECLGHWSKLNQYLNTQT